MSKIATFVSVAALMFCLLLALLILQERHQLYERVELLERLADSGTVMITLSSRVHDEMLSFIKAVCS